MARIAKKIFFDLPGFGRVHATGGSLKLAGEKRSGRVSDVGPAGYEEEYQHGEISFKVENAAGISGEKLHALTDQKITVSDDNGKTWVLNNSFSTELPSLSDGMWDCKFEFQTYEEEL